MAQKLVIKKKKKRTTKISTPAKTTKARKSTVTKVSKASNPAKVEARIEKEWTRIKDRIEKRLKTAVLPQKLAACRALVVRTTSEELAAALKRGRPSG